jgi:hypothetical protein
MDDSLDSNDLSPWIVPMINGGPRLEWKRNQAGLEVKIDPNCSPSAQGLDDETNEGREFPNFGGRARFGAYAARECIFG